MPLKGKTALSLISTRNPRRLHIKVAEEGHAVPPPWTTSPLHGITNSLENHLSLAGQKSYTQGQKDDAT